MTTTYSVKKSAELPKGYVTAEGFTRIAVSRNDGKKGKSGQFVELPKVSEQMINLIMLDIHGREWVEDCIDSIRSKVVSGIATRGELIVSDKCGITAILAMLAIETQSQRMTKESIGAWFDADLAPLLNTAIRAKIPTIDSARLDKLVAGYRSDFQALSARQVVMSNAVKMKLEKAIALLSDDYSNDSSSYATIGEKVIEALTELKSIESEDVL